MRPGDQLIDPLEGCKDLIIIPTAVLIAVITFSVMFAADLAGVERLGSPWSHLANSVLLYSVGIPLLLLARWLKLLPRLPSSSNN